MIEENIVSGIAFITDSNSGITQEEAAKYGIYVLPMPFMIDDQTYYEGTTISPEEFYRKQVEGARITTSQPTPEDVTSLWDEKLKEYDEIVYVPMSSGLSGSCQTAKLLALDYDGRVQVVDNQRISVTQLRSILDAKLLYEEKGMNASEIREFLEKDKFNSSIYVMLDTLTYLKRGGRITAAAAALGNILRLKPVLQIQGEKLDAFAKARTGSQGKTIMNTAIRNDIANRFSGDGSDCPVWLYIAHSHCPDAAKVYAEEVTKEFPGYEIQIQDLPLSIGCHLGPGALALACSRKIIV